MKAELFTKDREYICKICDILNDNKANDITVLDIAHISSITDYFVIATATSSTHAKGLVDNLENELEKMGYKIMRRDGLVDGRWSVLDFGNVVIHIFLPEIREFYNLEKLWNDGKNMMPYAEIEKLKGSQK